MEGTKIVVLETKVGSYVNERNASHGKFEDFVH